MASGLPTPPTRVFLDSSVLIAAAISSRGAGRELLLQGFAGGCQLAISPLVLTETERNLADKAPTALPDFRIFRASLLTTLVSPSRAVVLRVAKVVVVKDAPIVAAAMRARAAYLATYDRKDLLSHRKVIHEHFGVIAAAPEEILGVIRRARAVEGTQ